MADGADGVAGSSQEVLVAPEGSEFGVVIESMGAAYGALGVHQSETAVVVEAGSSEIHGAADHDFAQFTAIEIAVFTPYQCSDARQVGIGAGRAPKRADASSTVQDRIAVCGGNEGEV